MRGQDDALVQVAPLLKLRHLGVGFSRGSFGKRTSNSCVLTSKPVPLGDEEFLATLEETLAEFSDGKSPDPSHDPQEIPTGRLADPSPSDGFRYGVPGIPRYGVPGIPETPSRTCLSRRDLTGRLDVGL